MLATRYLASELDFPSYKHGDLRIVLATPWNNQLRNEFKMEHITDTVRIYVWMHNFWFRVTYPLDYQPYVALLDVLNIRRVGQFHVRASEVTSKQPYLVDYINPDVCPSVTLGTFCTASTRCDVHPLTGSIRITHTEQTDNVHVSHYGIDGWYLLGNCALSDFREHLIDKIADKMMFNFTHSLYLTILNPDRLKRHLPVQDRWTNISPHMLELMGWQ